MISNDDSLFAELKTDLELIEEQRQGFLKKFNLRKKIGWPAGVVLTALCAPIDWLLLFPPDGDGNAVGVTAIALGLLYTWVTKPKREYVAAYKQKVMPRIARVVGDLFYDAAGGIPMEKIKPSKIVPSYDKVKTEDYFEGHYKGVATSFSELKLTERRGSGKNRRTVTTFKGLVILLTMTKRKFLGHTIVTRDQGAVADWFTKKTIGLTRANLVDPVFEKQFNVYTNDQVEGRYLVDPLMMQKLTDLCAHYKGDSLMAAYYDSKMLIMINSKHNYFEPPDLHHPAVDINAVKMLREEVSNIAGIIDYLEIVETRAA